MTPKERLLARIHGQSVDRVPNLNILMQFAARYGGATMDRFCRDPIVLAECNIKACQDFGIDLLNTMSDPYRETADFGADISYPHDSLPVCPPFITGPQDMRRLKPFRMEDSRRMMDRLRSIQHYRQAAGQHWPVMGWVEGSMAECADLMGLTPLIFAMEDEPAMVHDMLDICLETALGCIQPQIQAGAELIGVGDAVASVLGPAVYREWVLPYEQRIFAEIRRCGAIGRLHICGNIAPLLPDLREVGADIIDVDWMVDFAAAYDALQDRALICGNFDPVSAVRDSTPDAVRAAVRACLRQGRDRCLIMAGCEIPRDTPHPCLLAVHEALAEGSL